MRGFVILALAVFAITGGAASMPLTAAAAPLAAPSSPAPAVHPPQLQQPVDDNDDTRVEVQLVVLGAVAALVIVGGLGAYLLKRRLGLIAPPPDQSSDSHH